MDEVILFFILFDLEAALSFKVRLSLAPPDLVAALSFKVRLSLAPPGRCLRPRPRPAAKLDRPRHAPA
jgi:hypothetical protein